MLLPLGRFAFLLFLITTLAVPTSTRITPLPNNSAECKFVNVVVNSLQAIPSATPFCSSFLHISTATKTKTVTAVVPSTSTTYIGTTTAKISHITTTTQTVTTINYTSTATATVFSTVTSNVCNATPTTVAKRAVTPSKLAAFASSQISTACECLDIPTPTRTVTVSTTSVKNVVVSAEATVLTTLFNTLPVTVTAEIPGVSTTTTTSTITITSTSCAAPTSCNNQGAEFAVYENVDGRANPDNYPGWNPEGYKTVQPLYQGVTPSVGNIVCDNDYEDDPCPIYNQFIYTTGFVAVDHRGYFYAGQTGTYTLTLVQPVDNVAEIWLGNKAYSGWTRANADADADLAQLRDPNNFPAHNVATVSMVAGQYLPFRVFWANGGGYGDLYFTFTAPDGTSLNNSPFLVTHSCDGSTAPPFAPWGLET